MKKGYRHSREAKRKISESRKGKTWEEIHGKEGAEKLRNILKGYRGPKSALWKGGRKIELGYVHIYKPEYPSQILGKKRL